MVHDCYSDNNITWKQGSFYSLSSWGETIAMLSMLPVNHNEDYSRTPVERPPSPATIPLIRPYFVWRTVFSVCTIPDQRQSLWRDQRPGQMEFSPSRTTTSRIPERLWNECPIEGSARYITQNIAYRGQKWLMTRPANIVDSERPNEHVRLNGEGKVINFGSARCRFNRLRRVETKVEIKRKWQQQATCGCQ